ncbi:sigma-70 family RNA polymerase sigma factor [Rhodohalobacter barkolensis]|uniref:sigma-70 family RNA polymerase sigma factor n=1 Tax=Rhodohalobacter barkolensis TaxID=2053187 RepID=UPI0013FDC396|nr:sigma-70 family RNA polymerase sigma factor [Rhodohalobacter barkolensis]
MNKFDYISEQLWKSYSDKVCYYFKSRMENNLLACDLMQDTFHKVLTNKKKLAEIQNHEAWIFQIARNTLIDYSRKKKEEKLDNLEIPDDQSSIIDSTSEFDEVSECLYELIDEYSQEDENYLREVFTKTLSQKEAAQALDIPYTTFKSRVQKARKIIINEFNVRCCHLKYNDQNKIIGCTPVRNELV